MSSNSGRLATPCLTPKSSSVAGVITESSQGAGAISSILQREKWRIERSSGLSKNKSKIAWPQALAGGYGRCHAEQCRWEALLWSLLPSPWSSPGSPSSVPEYTTAHQEHSTPRTAPEEHGFPDISWHESLPLLVTTSKSRSMQGESRLLGRDLEQPRGQEKGSRESLGDRSRSVPTGMPAPTKLLMLHFFTCSGGET